MSGFKDSLGDILYRSIFDGKTYEPSRDYVRLKGQMLAVFDLMADGQWRSLRQIADIVEGSEAAVSARLRDLRKEKFGAHVVDRKHVGCGLHLYRVKPKQ